MPERTYTEEEAHEILRRAVAQSADAGTLARQDLIAAAAEVGIGSAAVEAAISEHDSERAIADELARRKKERRKGLVSSVSNWAIVNAGLFGIDLATGDGWWVQWPLGAWGIVLLFKLKGSLFPDAEAERRAAARSVERQRREAERERASRARRAAGRELGDAIERGVDELLGAAARRARVADDASAGMPAEGPEAAATRARRQSS